MRFYTLLSLVALFCASCTNTAVDPDPQSTVVRVGTAVGDQAPDFTLSDTSGNSLSLSQLRGKVVLVDFWASWCQPCLVQLPDMKEAQAKYGEKGFIILGVSLDYTTRSWKQYLSYNNLNWLHVYDPGDTTGALARYGVTGIPRAFLLDRKGIIVRDAIHGYELDKVVGELVNK